MARAKRRGPKFTGDLAKPIDLRMIAPLNPEERDAFYDRMRDELRKRRLEKLVLLGKHYDIKVDESVVDENQYRVLFFGAIAMRLAIDFVPGFQEKKEGKWPRVLIHAMVEILDWAKANRARSGFKSDFHVALQHVQSADPELRRPGNLSRAKRRARTLCNLIASARASRRRKGQLH